MKFALVNNNKVEATKGAKATCPTCEAQVTAKCGEDRVHHWAHIGKRNCDPWWENETEWHRNWKNNFPSEWQEFVLVEEQSGEKHIADIRRTDGLVIEFQHSYINPEERRKRESFYENMLWVVDGTRLKKDLDRFINGNFHPTKNKGIYELDFNRFPSAWVKSAVPVIFDFRGFKATDVPDNVKKNVFYLLPNENEPKALIVVMSREYFINNIKSGELFKKQNEQQKQTLPPPISNHRTMISKPQSHVYNPKTGIFSKRRRF